MIYIKNISFVFTFTLTFNLNALRLQFSQYIYSFVGSFITHGNFMISGFHLVFFSREISFLFFFRTEFIHSSIFFRQNWMFWANLMNHFIDKRKISLEISYLNCTLFIKFSFNLIIILNVHFGGKSMEAFNVILF